MNTNFTELSMNELEAIDGGIGFILGCVIGAVGAWVVDGVVDYTTGRSCGEWVSYGLGKVFG